MSSGFLASSTFSISGGMVALSRVASPRLNLMCISFSFASTCSSDLKSFVAAARASTSFGVGKEIWSTLEQLPLVELLGMALDVAVDFVFGDRAHLARQIALNESAGEDLLPRAQEIEMHGRLAIELRRERLLHQILAFDDARQRPLDDCVGALVSGHVGEAKLVVQLLLRDVVRADMSDDLPDHGLRLLLLAASGEQHRRRQRARERSDAPPAPRNWRYMQQGYFS